MRPDKTWTTVNKNNVFNIVWRRARGAFGPFVTHLVFFASGSDIVKTLFGNNLSFISQLFATRVCAAMMKRQPEQTKEIKEENVLFLVGQVPPFIEAFRYHPVRLLRLLDSNKAIRQVFDKMVEQYKTDVWYYLCVHAFPNEMLMLHSMSQLALYGEIHGHAYKKCMHKYFFPLADDKTYLEAYKRDLLSPQMKIRHDKMLDRSFLDPVLRQECLSNKALAYQTQEAFKILFPFGTPPAEYCFSSQMALQRLTLHFFSFLVHCPGISPRGRTPEWMFVLLFHLIGRSMQAMAVFFENDDINLYENFRQRLSVTNCLDIINESIEGIKPNGFGPRDLKEESIGEFEAIQLGPFNQPTFTLIQLKINIDYYIKNGRAIEPNGRYFTEEELDVIKKMYRQVTKEMIIYSSDKDIELYRDEDVFEEAFAQRKQNLQRYGTFDPLYWSVMRQEEQVISNIFVNWEPVLRNLVNITLANANNTPDDMTDYLAMTCHFCGNTATAIQDAAPFRLYCGHECHVRAHER
jgi:hypothetical protein